MKAKNTTPRSDLKAVLAALRAGRSFLVTTHVCPDGDAIGSVLAVRLFLDGLGKPDVTCALDAPVPRIYQWLPGVESIIPPDRVTVAYDTVVLVDAATRDRVGRAADLIRPGHAVIVIDHHADAQPEGDVNFVDGTYGSAGEIVAELFDLARVPMTYDAALCIYVALATDTGCFRFGNTGPRSHRTAAQLLEFGLDVHAISNRLFDAMSPAQFQLVRRVFNSIRFHAQGRIAAARVTLQDLADTGARQEDLNNLVNVGRNIDGVAVSILLRETSDGQTKVSFRSRPPVDCAALAAHFGGGGHPGAAGATVPHPLDAAYPMIVEYTTAHIGNAP
ncbi:MAG: bifunctional oligoribonuclease/PAP phosphatase NrnA [Candidatus Hydrogenedentes bacterium]|nr:bifunctional oligoribonuclease/PAP phosphatase NrnA [Candidatus Hydrogenedentota bacterium]